ncbi:LPXTG cell wall anchor domain-containing protein [Dactylosporangium sp. NPDC000555]|uniref:LPXTG cell wall anchor domain-containing protein n=1 Tax=Dactylosporangium sp. NPDC000555 TaxID=3154260 RepID=UPI00331F6DC9
MPNSLRPRLAFVAGAAVVAFGAFGTAPALAQEPDTFDLGIAEVTVSGAVGAIVPVKLTVRSNGPQAADVVREAVIERPTGTEFAAPIPAGCVSHSTTNRYYCTATGGLAVGASVSFEFNLKIIDAHPGAGVLFFADGGREDRDNSNDHAALTVNVTAPTGGQSSASASASPSASASSSAGTARPSASPAPGLPVTGDRTGLYAGVGAALVAAGVALFLVARRRRIRLVTPER